MTRDHHAFRKWRETLYANTKPIAAAMAYHGTKAQRSQNLDSHLYQLARTLASSASTVAEFEESSHWKFCEA